MCIRERAREREGEREKERESEWNGKNILCQLSRSVVRRRNVYVVVIFSSECE